MSVSYYRIVLKEIDNLTGLLACEKQKRQIVNQRFPTLNVMEESHTVDNLQSQNPVNYQLPSAPSQALHSKGTDHSYKNPQQSFSVLKC